MAAATRKFQLYLIKPSHYDDDGYVIQWWRSAIPSNTLAVLYGLADDCARRRVLGDTDIEIVALDETNSRINPEKIAAAIRASGGLGLAAFVGVQSNQFPHAMDLSRRFRKLGIEVAIGGFHVSGCLAMLPELPADLKEAQALGVSLFAGEAEEGRLDTVLRDAAAGTLAPLYNFMKDLPSIDAAPMPVLPAAKIERTAGVVASFDAGRGCPFQCSFCTIINVQGRKSRYRSPDDIEGIVRENLKNGIQRFFITDDNMARNKNWEPIFDRLIAVREETKVGFSIIIQVDTLCHRIPNFIEKAARAGVRRVFIGLENINPDSLVGAKKKQNRISEYRDMLLQWKKVCVFTYAGYILGFPTDTPETIVRDIKIIQRELPLDLLEFFCLTPLPGSEDHKKLQAAGVAMDPDMNKYDLEHVTTGHPIMSKADWERAYRLAWETYYTPEHMETILKRAVACGISPGKMIFLLVWFWGSVFVEKIHPLESGYLRRKVRTDRRPGLPIESALTFYPKYVAQLVGKHLAMGRLILRLQKVRRALKSDPNAKAYMDTALTPVDEHDTQTLEMFSVSEGARAVATKVQKKAAMQAAE